MTDRQLRNKLSLNKLIEPLQALISTGKLKPTDGTALATLTPEEQQTLYDTLGEAYIGKAKAAIVTQAKREAAPSHTESEIQAILRRVKALQGQNDVLEAQLREQSTADPDADLADQLVDVQAERDHLAAEVAKLQATPPSVVERIIEKAVPTPDPSLVERLDELQKRIVGEQRKVETAEKKRLETQAYYKQRLAAADKQAGHLAEQLAQAQAALQAIGQSRKAEDVALTHGGTLLFQLRSAAAPLLAAWPKLAPLSIHCRLPDIEATAEVQAIAEQLAPIVEALHRVIEDNQAEPAPVIDITSRQPALPT